MKTEPWFRSGGAGESKWVVVRKLTREWLAEDHWAPDFVLTQADQRADFRAEGSHGARPTLDGDDAIILASGARDLEEIYFVTVFPGFGWDGSSFVSVDSRLNIVASVFHDALYRASRRGKFGELRAWEHTALRRAADAHFGRLMRRRMRSWPLRPWQWFRSWYHEIALKIWAARAWRPRDLGW